ncbi:MAG: butanol dehydrogenase [Firmicutes bacterium]|nr:butanol dehydrogenase [Bacillota bacterium]
MQRFTIPRDIYFGSGCMTEVLAGLEGKRAVVVTGGNSMQKFGFLDKAITSLRKAGMEVKLIEGVEPDPSVETVYHGAELMCDFEPDWIVAIGGGSPIDAAKAMWIFYEHPEKTFDDVKEPFTVPALRSKARFAAIPSTSGTATEVTAFSVITDYSTKIKYPLADYNLTPDIAIVDSDLAETMPLKLVAHTGMDALTHALEAYVATGRSSFSDPLALQAILMVQEYIIKSYQGDREAREQMHIAQCLAGMAFTNALLGITHSMAHKIGALYHIPHGCANAILLPFVIDFNKKTASADYAKVAKTMGMTGSSQAELVDNLVAFIDELNRLLDIPANLELAGVASEFFAKSLESIAANALKDPCTSSNPRAISFEEMKRLFTCAFNGEKVDF